MLDAQSFRRDWEAHGPMVPGLDPMEAVDRLKKFKQMFEVCSLEKQLHAGRVFRVEVCPCCDWHHC